MWALYYCHFLWIGALLSWIVACAKPHFRLHRLLWTATKVYLLVITIIGEHALCVCNKHTSPSTPCLGGVPPSRLGCQTRPQACSQPPGTPNRLPPPPPEWCSPPPPGDPHPPTWPHGQCWGMVHVSICSGGLLYRYPMWVSVRVGCNKDTQWEHVIWTGGSEQYATWLRAASFLYVLRIFFISFLNHFCIIFICFHMFFISFLYLLRVLGGTYWSIFVWYRFACFLCVFYIFSVCFFYLTCAHTYMFRICFLYIFHMFFISFSYLFHMFLISFLGSRKKDATRCMFFWGAQETCSYAALFVG